MHFDFDHEVVFETPDQIVSKLNPGDTFRALFCTRLFNLLQEILSYSQIKFWFWCGVRKAEVIQKWPMKPNPKLNLYSVAVFEKRLYKNIHKGNYRTQSQSE